MNNKKIFGMVIGVIAFIALIAGATFAWLTWSSTPTTIGGTTSTFSINYSTPGGAINNQALVPSATYSTATGDYTYVTISRTNESLTGKANLVLNVTTLTLNGTCTTEGVITYGPQASCSGTWETADASKIHWAVYTGGSTTDTATTEVGSGTFADVSANKIALVSNATLNTTDTYYFVYIWLDSTAGNEFVGSTFSGYIAADATQDQA